MTAYDATAADTIGPGDTSENIAVLDNVLTQALTLALSGDGIAQISDEVSEDFTYADETVNIVKFIDVVAENMDYTDTPVVTGLLVASVEETTTFDDSLTLNAILSLAVADQMAIGMLVTLAGEEFVCWVSNTDTFAHSRYDAFDFESMCKVGPKYLGCKDDGIYELHAADDAGDDIETFLSTGMTDNGESHLKRVPCVFVGLASDGDILLRVITDNAAEHVYRFTRISEGIVSTDLKIGRGIRSRYWQFDLLNVENSEQTFEDITFYPVVLGRRVQG